MKRMLLAGLLAAAPVFGQFGHEERTVQLTCAAAVEQPISIELHTDSGAPLVIHMQLRDPSRSARHLRVDTGVAVFELTLPARGEHSVTLTPFADPGVYDLLLEVDTVHGTCTREYRIGFMDFRWGRDNFRFANNGATRHGEVRPYSIGLLEWAGERFGELDTVEDVALIYRTYDLFKGATGRCYAFSVSQARFMDDPDLLPAHSPSVYRIFAGASVIQREMNMLQNDTVFAYFVAGPYDVHRRQSTDERAAEVQAIMDRIETGRAAPFGYLGDDRHHSMLAYGFIYDPAAGTVQLVSANNWTDQLSSNLSSADAETVLVRMSETEGDSIRWLDEPVRAYRSAGKIVFVDPDRIGRPDEDSLQHTVARVLETLRSPDSRTAIVVETVRYAMLVDGDGNRAGRDGGRRFTEIPGVRYRVHGENMVFEVPEALWDGLELVMHRLEGEESEVLPQTRVALLDPGDPLGGIEPAARIVSDVSMNPAEPTRAALRDLYQRE